MDDIETLVAVGDSVVWGQGLRHEQKFMTRVFDVLSGAERLPERNIKAHSGAVIGIDRPNPSAPRFRQLRDVELEFGPIGTRTGRHDKPNAGLTILQQLDRLPYDYFEHDGPGDHLERGEDRAYEPKTTWTWSSSTAGSTTSGWSRSGSTSVTGRTSTGGSETLLRGPVGAHRPDASEVPERDHRRQELLPVPELRVRGKQEAIDTLSAVVGVLFGLPWSVAARLLGELVRRAITNNVLRVNRLQLASVRRAVTEPNRALGGPGVVFATPRLRGGERPERAWAWLWPILEADDLVPTGTVGDHKVAAQRLAVCEATDSGIACRHAATAHPNPVGANVYAGMILERLGQHRESAVRELLSHLQGGATDAPVDVCEQADRGLDVAHGLRTELVHTTVDSLTLELESRLKGGISAVMVTSGGEVLPIGLQLPAVSPDIFAQWRVDPIPIDPISSTNRPAVNPIRLWELEDLRIWAEPLGRFPGTVGPSGPSGDLVGNANVETVWEVGRFALSINGVEVYADDNRRTLPAGDDLSLPYPVQEQ